MFRRLLPFSILILLIACSPDLSDPAIQHAVVQTLTATAWTPTPTTTPEPNTSGVVDILNSVMIGSDPLEETIDARFSVLDSQVLFDPPTKQALTLQIDVDCEWVFSDGCTPEGSFVVLMRAFRANSKTFRKICDDIPSTIRSLHVITFDRMVRRGMLAASWDDVQEYVAGTINGTQFGSRTVQITSAP
ncbi:MAG TPA: hypothetical protein VLX61_04275 [Anaerolineales bacterium]|nr:hypothetical protein [Anaerolineales bacterium]